MSLNSEAKRLKLNGEQMNWMLKSTCFSKPLQSCIYTISTGCLKIARGIIALQVAVNRMVDHRKVLNGRALARNSSTGALTW
jgi:hypothetical protein